MRRFPDVGRASLGAALTRARREELIPVNVARLTTLSAPPPKKVKPWTADEARAFLAAARSEPLYPAFVLLLVYGLRRGEVLGISWDDVDLDDDVDWRSTRTATTPVTARDSGGWPESCSETRKASRCRQKPPPEIRWGL